MAQLCDDRIQGSFAFGVPKFILYRDAINLILSRELLLRLVRGGVLRSWIGRATQRWAGEANALLFTISSIGSRPVDRVGMDRFGIATELFLVSFNLTDKVVALIISVSTESVQADIFSENVTDGSLGSTHERGVQFIEISFRFFASFAKRFEVGWVGDIGRSASSIHAEFSRIGRGRRRLFIVFVAQDELRSFAIRQRWRWSSTQRF